MPLLIIGYLAMVRNNTWKQHIN